MVAGTHRPTGTALATRPTRLAQRIGTRLAFVVLAGCASPTDERPAITVNTLPPAARPETPSVRVTMLALHQMGGVPPGWKLGLPPGDPEAGRQVFADYGCPSCHRVAGEPFENEADGGVGPALTGMGSHHPPEYFAESILNPDAVLVEGEGFISEGGRSTMPSYPDMTLAQLADVVAYISSLKMGGEHAMDHPMPGDGVPLGVMRQRPTPPEQPAKAFFTQSYEVNDGQVAAFEAWFQSEGAKKFLGYPGLVSIETFVDTGRPGVAVTSVFGFTDQDSMQRFLNDKDTIAMGEEFDSFIGPHDHRAFVRPPVYRAPGLSASAPR
jgi:mono/diheme cytochrome c family protein